MKNDFKLLRNVKSKLVWLTGPLGGYLVAKTVTRKQPRILMYHRFSDEKECDKTSAATFETQMTILRDKFNVRALTDVISKIRDGQQVEPDTVVITVDDGYSDFYQIAFPVLKKYKLPATLYAVTDFIDKKVWLWPDKIEYILNNTTCNALNIVIDNKKEKVLLETRDEKYAAWLKVMNYCAYLWENERLEFIDNLALLADVKVNDSPVFPYKSMDWEQVRELADNNITIGAHTRSHPILSRIDEHKLEHEIAGSKQRIEEETGSEVSCFCYPNGQYNDYTRKAKETIINSGFSNATVAFADTLGWKDHFELRRYGVGDNMFHFCKVINGMEMLSHALRRKYAEPK